MENKITYAKRIQHVEESQPNYYLHNMSVEEEKKEEKEKIFILLSKELIYYENVHCTKIKSILLKGKSVITVNGDVESNKSLDKAKLEQHALKKSLGFKCHLICENDLKTVFNFLQLKCLKST